MALCGSGGIGTTLALVSAPVFPDVGSDLLTK